MSGVPYIFTNATTSIPLSELDSNFATPVTIGSTSVALGNTVTILTGLSNVGANVIGTTSNVALAIQANNTTGIYVNTNNLITTPSQVGFEAGIASTSDTTVNASSYVPFNAVNYQRGSSFSTSNYYFTAPIAGYYFFTVGLYFTNTASSTGSMQAGFVKNGSFITTASGDAQGCISATPNSLGGTIEIGTGLVISLSAGDTVGVQPRTSSIRIYQGHCYFSGYLLG
jgi:C1q domain